MQLVRCALIVVVAAYELCGRVAVEGDDLGQASAWSPGYSSIATPPSHAASLRPFRVAVGHSPDSGVTEFADAADASHTDGHEVSFTTEAGSASGSEDTSASKPELSVKLSSPSLRASPSSTGPETDVLRRVTEVLSTGSVYLPSGVDDIFCDIVGEPYSQLSQDARQWICFILQGRPRLAFTAALEAFNAWSAASQQGRTPNLVIESVKRYATRMVSTQDAGSLMTSWLKVRQFERARAKVNTDGVNLYTASLHLLSSALERGLAKRTIRKPAQSPVSEPQRTLDVVWRLDGVASRLVKYGVCFVCNYDQCTSAMIVEPLAIIAGVHVIGPKTLINEEWSHVGDQGPAAKGFAFERVARLALAALHCQLQTSPDHDVTVSPGRIRLSKYPPFVADKLKIPVVADRPCDPLIGLGFIGVVQACPTARQPLVAWTLSDDAGPDGYYDGHAISFKFAVDEVTGRAQQKSRKQADLTNAFRRKGPLSDIYRSCIQSTLLQMDVWVESHIWSPCGNASICVEQRTVGTERKPAVVYVWGHQSLRCIWMGDIVSRLPEDFVRVWLCLRVPF